MSRKTNLPDPFPGVPLTKANFALMENQLGDLSKAVNIMLSLYALGTEGERPLLSPVLLISRKLILASEFKTAKGILMTAQRLALFGGHHNRVRDTLDLLANKALASGDIDIAIDAQSRAMKAFNIRPVDLYARSLRHIELGRQALLDGNVRRANRVMCRLLRIPLIREETYRLGFEILDATEQHGDKQTSLDVLAALRADLGLAPDFGVENILTCYSCWLKNEDGTALKPIVPPKGKLFLSLPARPADTDAVIRAKKQAVSTFCRTTANITLIL